MKLFVVVKKDGSGVVVEEGNGLLKRNDNLHVSTISAEEIICYPSHRRYIYIVRHMQGSKGFIFFRAVVPKSLYEKVMAGNEATNDGKYKVDSSWVKGESREVLVSKIFNNLASMGLLPKQSYPYDKDYYCFDTRRKLVCSGIKEFVDFNNISATELSVNDMLESRVPGDLAERAARRSGRSR